MSTLDDSNVKQISKKEVIAKRQKTRQNTLAHTSTIIAAIGAFWSASISTSLSADYALSTSTSATPSISASLSASVFLFVDDGASQATGTDAFWFAGADVFLSIDICTS